MLQFDIKPNGSNEVIKVMGVGGGGGNAVNRMIHVGIAGVEYIVANTDLQALNASEAETKIQLGAKLTRGLGSGANPEIGQKAAEESIDEVKRCLEGTDMLFITAGMGKGTGTGAAPIIARASKEMGILTVGIVTKPFDFEGPVKIKKAEKGIEELRKYVDTIIIIPNDKIIENASKDMTMDESFELADEVLKEGVKGIADVIKAPGLLNVDFADIRTVLQDNGEAHMGVGRAKGENRALDAAKAAINSPMLDTTIRGAKSVLINVAGVKNDIKMQEFRAAAEYIRQELDQEEAEIILGVIFNEDLGEHISITVIATNFSSNIPSFDFPEDEFSIPEESSEEARSSDEPRDLPIWLVRPSKK
ncbi:MAG: cell division protein FtsZ [Peptostreptococcaceae bacterium]|nr:cell division protein FtsZ [Peptostreptococcaceae bacterium]